MLVLTFAVVLFAASDRTDAPSGDVAAFNQRFDDAIRAMDNEAIIAMWAENGVDLMPGQVPITGKAEIAKFIREMGTKLKGYKVTKHETEYHIISLDSHTVAEWTSAKQTVMPPDASKPLEASGRIVLVLEKSGSEWKIKSEMWQSAP